MTVTGQSSGRHHPVDPTLEGVQHFDNIKPTGARHLNDYDIGRILHSQRTSQISRSIGTMATTKSGNFG